MKIRESGMPEIDYWESLFDASQFLGTIGFPQEIESVAEFGAGYGTFTLALAKNYAAQVYALDLDGEMLQTTYRRALEQSLENITLVQCNFLEEGAHLSSDSVDAALIAHLLHGAPQENLILLEEAHRILKTEGRLGIIHWRRDVDTPRGPPLEFRLAPEAALELCSEAGFETYKSEIKELGNYHWGFMVSKRAT